MINNKNFINNQWVVGRSQETLTVYDKYDQSLLADIHFLDKAQINKTIESAQTGFSQIKKWSKQKRSSHLLKLYDLLTEKQEMFVNLIVKEAGKPRSYAEAELKRCLTTIELGAKAALHDHRENVDVDYDAGKGKKAFTDRFPIGVVLCITPFNFPLNLLLHKVVPAIACGCSVIVKPPPQSPLSALALAELIKECDYPAGVYNVAICAIPEAEALVKDERISKLSFTGSDKVGWHLKSICGKKKVTLELGGNAAVLIDNPFETNNVAKQIAIGAFLYAGQICISTQRIYAVGESYDSLVEELLNEIDNLKTGNPKDAEVIVGPVISKEHLQRIDNWVKEAIHSGAELLSGGKILDSSRNIYAPTLLSNTSNSMKVVSEEVFAPVVIIEKVESFEEGISKINDSKFGLQAGIFTNNQEKINLAFNELAVGGVIANGIPGFRVDGMPYGGVKDSGLGREGINYTIEEMTELRLLVY